MLGSTWRQLFWWGGLIGNWQESWCNSWQLLNRATGGFWGMDFSLREWLDTNYLKNCKVPLYVFLLEMSAKKKKIIIFTTFIIPGESFLQQESQVSVNSKLSGYLVLSMHWLKDVFCVIIPTSPWSPRQIHCYLYWLSQCPWVIRSSRGKDGLRRRCPPTCYSSLFFRSIVFTIWGSQQEP